MSECQHEPDGCTGFFHDGSCACPAAGCCNDDSDECICPLENRDACEFDHDNEEPIVGKFFAATTIDPTNAKALARIINNPTAVDSYTVNHAEFSLKISKTSGGSLLVEVRQK